MSKLNFSTENCPICKSKMNIIIEQKDVDFVGKIWIFTYKCNNCGYKKTDVMIDKIRPPRKITFVVERTEDLYIKVIKSSSATVRLPELEYEIKPGPAAMGKITNIEGILRDFLDGLTFFRDNTKKIEQIRERILKTIEGKDKLTVVIEDPLGQSDIISKKAKVEEST